MEKCGFKREMGERDGRGWGEGGELAVVGGGDGQGAGGGGRRVGDVSLADRTLD